MRNFIMAMLILSIGSCTTMRNKKVIHQKNHLKTDLNIDSIPQLTYQQMLEEHDTLVSYIKQINPIIYFNKEVRGIDFEEYATHLREKINKNTTMSEYLNIVKRTINAAQDGHTSIVRTSMAKSLKSQVVGYDSTALKYTKYYDDYYTKTFYTKSNIDLVYINGEYYTLLPFMYKGKKYPQALKITKCNGENIHQFVDKMTEWVSPFKWDIPNNRNYIERFINSSYIYKDDVLHLTFEDEKQKIHQLYLKKGDTVTLLKKKINAFDYNDYLTNNIKTYYYEKERLLYVYLPSMRVGLGDSLNAKIQRFFDEKPIKSIAIDIRGNGGGDDTTYTTFLKNIVKDSLTMNLIVGRNYSPITKKHYNINDDTIANNKVYTLEANVPRLNGTKMFYIQLPNYTFVAPSKKTRAFRGKIYIIQDRLIYSSSSNLAKLAKTSDQLVSVGENPNLFGGIQTSPVFACLPYSKIMFRTEPQVDFSDAKTKKDIFQNHVEHHVNYPIEFLTERITTHEDIHGKDFIYHKDPMFQKVLELEQE